MGVVIREINEIIVHCSDSKWGNAEVIDQWHKERGWSEIGYNTVILNGYIKSSRNYVADYDGFVEKGRDIGKVPAHCKGHNSNSIGICLIGVDEFTPLQAGSLLNMLEYYCEEYNIDPDNIFGHYEFSEKTCPNFSVEPLRDVIKGRLKNNV